MFDDVHVPENLDEYIREGIRQAKGRKKRAAAKRWSGVAVVVLVTVFLGAVRISPAFAAYAARIPGLEYLVSLISHDKGLLAAVDNEFIQHVGASFEAEGIIFTVKDIIIDKTGMVVFYSVENKGGWKWPQVRDVKLEDEYGRDLKVSASYGHSRTDGNRYDEKMEFFFHEDKEGKRLELPDRVFITSRMAVFDGQAGDAGKPVDSKKTDETVAVASNERVLESVWRVPLAIDKSRFGDMEKTYVLNETVTVEGQRITFEKLTVYPTRVCIDIAYEPDNTKKIFTFEDLALVDEKGEQWKGISNGITASLTGRDTVRLYFQSNYFSSPRELYLTGSRMRALDKAKLDVVVDLENKKLLKAPDGKIVLQDVRSGEGSLVLSMDISKDELDGNVHYGILHYEGEDEGGNRLELYESGISTSGDGKSDEQFFRFKYKGELKGRLHFTINDYPQRIREEFKIAIPLN